MKHGLQRFKVGDHVRWVSQAAGHTKEKVGTVVEVVPAGQYPAKYIKGSGAEFAVTRPHESYVVHVPSGYHQKHYWPRVSTLDLWPV